MLVAMTLSHLKLYSPKGNNYNFYWTGNGIHYNKRLSFNYFEWKRVWECEEI